MTRIGIFGGTFSPPHKGHVESAVAFMEQMWLDILYVIPAFQPPHKEMEIEVSAVDRLEMTKLAFQGIEGVYVSDMEIRRGGKSYTVDTLKALSGEDRRLFLLCGTDMMLSLDTWYQPEEIFHLSYPTYVRREKDDFLEKKIIEKIAQYREKYGKVVRRIVTDPVEISSTELRRRLRENLPLDEYLSPAVIEYIKEHRLYE